MFTSDRTSVLQAPSEISLERGHPRSFPSNAEYPIENFDYKNIFYDVFKSGKYIYFIGPPLDTFYKLLRDAYITYDLEAPAVKFKLFPKMRCVVARAVVNARVKQVHIRFANGHLQTIAVGSNKNKSLTGSKALIAISKNNSLKWIEDWARYHVMIHKVDTIIIYDNNSTQYGLNSIVQTLKNVSGLNNGIVVDWPFPFGPQRQATGKLPGIGAYGNFAQAAMYEHVRRKYLREATYTLNVDIDEYVITEDSKSVFDHVSDMGNGGLTINGKWLETIGAPKRRLPRCFDFRYYDKYEKECSPKWCIENAKISSASQWRTHWIEGINLTSSDKVRHVHMRGLGRNIWRSEKTLHKPDSAIHEIDHRWQEIAKRVFSLTGRAEIYSVRLKRSLRQHKRKIRTRMNMLR